MKRTPRHGSLLLLGLMCCAGCRSPRVGPTASPIPLPARFSASGASALPDAWWTAFADERLSALVEEALAGSFTLRVAWDRLDQARALAAKSGAGLWPELGGSAGVSRTVSKAGGAERDYQTGYALGLGAAYEVDLWGRVRAARDAARLDALASEQDLRAAAITLSAEIARAWFQLVETRGQLRLVDEQLATNEDYLEVITLRFRRGRASATDVLQQRQLVQSKKGDRHQLRSAIEVLEHRLAILVGRPPGRLELAVPEDLPEAPALPETGAPAIWVRLRPDLRAAELRVRAADRDAAAAIADRFPRLALSLQAETSAERVRDLFDNWLAGLAANLTAPLLDGGERRAEADRTRAAASEALNSYGQAVLQALGEVEDALTQEARQEEYVASLAQELALSAEATEQTRQSYIRTGSDFTRYLTTLIGHQRLQRICLESRRRRIEYRINLYRALGGALPPARPGPHSAAPLPPR